MTTYLKPRVHGLLAEFEKPTELLEAAKQAYAKGYRRMDAYSPVPVHGLAEAIGMKSTILPYLVLLGAMTGVAAGYGMQFFASVIDYPWNVGGKPAHSWPAFIPITFEVGILLGSFVAVFGMLLLNGLPKPYHPLFNVQRFAMASRDRFFLCIESRDPLFDLQRTEAFLKELNARGVFDVEE